MPPSEIAVDPFGLWPSARSAVAGLGGSEPARSPRYAFASSHCTARDGEIAFSLAFEGLQASEGVLRLRVAARKETAVRGRWIVDERVGLKELAQAGGRRRIACRSRADTQYALAGQVEGATDARASSLALTLEGFGASTRFEARLQAARGRVLGARSPGGPPTLAAPASQMCTASQMEEAVYGDWIARLRLPRLWHRKQWEVVYVLQALADRIGPGARGLGFGSGAECFASYLASRGCDVLATDLASQERDAAGWIASGQHSEDAAGLFWPDLCSRDAFDRHVSFRAVDMRRIPDDLAGFDFCWSACAFEHLGSIAAGLEFVENSLRPLKPGGLAVHTTELNLTSNGRTLDHAGTVLFRRRDMERLARRLRRRGHRVAPLNFDPGDGALDGHVDVPPYAGSPHLRLALQQYVSTSFGLIVEKAGAS